MSSFTKEEKIKTIRNKLAKEMNNYIINLENEDIFEWWYAIGIPEEPQDIDFEFLENENYFNKLAHLFYLCVQLNEKENKK